jgi:hypothetical protein
VNAAISDLWAYVSVSTSSAGGEALCYLNGRPLVAASEAEAKDMLRQALLTPGRVRLRHFSVSTDSGPISMALADLVDALEHVGDDRTVST